MEASTDFFNTFKHNLILHSDYPVVYIHLFHNKFIHQKMYFLCRFTIYACLPCFLKDKAYKMFMNILIEVCNSRIFLFFFVPSRLPGFLHLFSAYRGFVARKEYKNAKHNRKVEEYITKFQASKNCLLSCLLMCYPYTICWPGFSLHWLTMLICLFWDITCLLYVCIQRPKWVSVFCYLYLRVV